MSKIHQTNYAPVFPDYNQWSVTKLSRNKEEFLNQVIDESCNRIIKGKKYSSLVSTLENAVFKERNRVKLNPWKVDPRDDLQFWNSVRNEIQGYSDFSEDIAYEKAKKLVRKIITRYAKEIFTPFNNGHYQFIKYSIKFVLGRLLSASRTGIISKLFSRNKPHEEKIKIMGDVDHLRKLSEKGTIILLPTHFSNLDSVLVGWFIEQIGLSPFIYAAGLNLFNYSFFSYFMRVLGAYKVDRRKKSSLYLATLITYSTLAIERGCHSVIYPGGTRSRSGNVATELKLGLLNSVVHAQRLHCEKKKPSEELKKIYIVPIALNYHFVLESPKLIRSYLEKVGKERFYDTTKKGSIPYKIKTFLFKFFTKDSDMSVTIGSPIDVFGNKVNLDGESIDNQGNKIDLTNYFLKDGKITQDAQRDQEYTKILGKKVSDRYHLISQIFSSHLVAFVAFKMMFRNSSQNNIYDFFRLPEDEIVLDYEIFKKEVLFVRNFILKNEKDIVVAYNLNNDIDEVIKDGINNVGMYHARLPLLRKKDGNIYSKDLITLYYYHNRLDGFGIEELRG